MNTPIDSIRISKQGRDQLIKIRRQTGIENWNILCRWAFCLSLREPTAPPQPKQRLEGGVEMTWKVFGGEEAETYAALLAMRMKRDTIKPGPDASGKCLRAHIHRGLSYLASGTETRSVADFTERWVEEASPGERSH